MLAKNWTGHNRLRGYLMMLFSDRNFLALIQFIRVKDFIQLWRFLKLYSISKIVSKIGKSCIRLFKKRSSNGYTDNILNWNGIIIKDTRFGKRRSQNTEELGGRLMNNMLESNAGNLAERDHMIIYLCPPTNG